MSTIDPGRVLLTGGSGFIGSHVLRQLRAQGLSPRVLTHTAKVDAADQVAGDLADPDSLAGVCEGVTTLVHAASLIGGDEQACWAINARGTAALVAEARRAGVRRIVHLSTAAVYGDGSHQGPAEDEIEPAPVSPTSVSRLAGERAVRSAGGTVLRPMFVYGRGDRWFLPGVARLAARLSGRPEGGRARLSLISVDKLAETVCAMVRTDAVGQGGSVFHVTHPEPTSVREILDVLAAQGLVREAAGDISHAQAVAELGEGAARALDLVSLDHFYDSSRLWRTVQVAPGAGFRQTFARYAQWYGRELGAGVAN
ncbi:NAD-dependent epimerase/dehydratase family protein [Streptomyces rubradiris]|uniref:NAD-dependent epimerase/dehydratase family protein n=1 Tax=Streptomyces rubradiris TaxID=285531 RepID=UPI0033DE9000